MINDDTVTLTDGRTLAFSSVGDGAGPVVVYHHGAPGSRLELTGLDAAFTAAGIRVITPDRPGYGGSTPNAGRTTADFAGDVGALVDHLDVERFGVIGLSSGGPYAVATAALLPDRVIAAVVAAGNTDMSWPPAADGYLESELRIMGLADVDAAVRLAEETFGVDGGRFFEGEMDLGPTDNAWLADADHASSLFASMAEAFAQGVAGYAHDIWVQGRPWSFDPGAITCPVVVVHGADDRLVPIAHSRHTAESIPTAELRIIDGVGHLSLVEVFPALASEVAGPGRSTIGA